VVIYSVLDNVSERRDAGKLHQCVPYSLSILKVFIAKKNRFTYLVEIVTKREIVELSLNLIIIFVLALVIQMAMDYH